MGATNGGYTVTASPLVGGSSTTSSGEISPDQGGDEQEALMVSLLSGEPDEEEIQLVPPSPPGEPDPELVERVQYLHDLRKRGRSIRDYIQGSRDWSNPYILERVIKVFELDEHGSNYPKDIFDPARVAEHPSDYYDAPECERPPLPKRAKKNGAEAKGGRGVKQRAPPPSPADAGATPPV